MGRQAAKPCNAATAVTCGGTGPAARQRGEIDGMPRLRTTTTRTQHRDPGIMPQHDGLVPRSSGATAEGLVPVEVVLERAGWDPPRVARWLGYPDAVLYDPRDRGAPPLTLYDLGRVRLAEAAEANGPEP